jgi:hypothetical protein
MEWTRRRAIANGLVAVGGGLAGCTGEGAERASERDGDWRWSGTIPVDGVTQHHEPSCERCGAYADYLERHGFDVSVEPASDAESLAETKAALGVPESVRSRHTVEFGAYVVEGHVPLEAIETVFEIDASFDGISVPGTPQHAPGTGPRGEGPQTIYAFRASGGTSVFIEVE